jgi:chemotaxis signal transduction protein
LTPILDAKESYHSVLLRFNREKKFCKRNSVLRNWQCVLAVVTFTHQRMSNRPENNSISFRLIGIDTINVAVPEDHITTVVDWTEPTQLPFGPRAILGVICVQGRMFTVLDLVRLLRPETEAVTTARLIVALRGDEQLALAVDTAETIDVPLTNIRSADQNTTGLFRESLMHAGRDWQILNVDELFNSLAQGRERRRRRT